MTKRLILALAIALAAICTKAQAIKVEVDEVHELSSIVWRLAGAEEYGQCSIPGYASDIDTYFDDCRKHPLIAYCKELRTTQGIAYDAIPTAAGFLCKTGDGIGFVPGYDARSVADTDGRWTEASCAKYVALLDSFYRQSRFDEFFTQHKPLYDKVVKAFEATGGNNVDIGWFEEFYGEKFPGMTIFVCPNNGPSNYGANKKAPEGRNGIVMASLWEQDGEIKFADSAGDIAIHEVTHYFANPIRDRYDSLFASGTLEVLFWSSFEKFNATAVGITSIPGEWLTRLASLCYTKDHPTGQFGIEFAIGNEMNSGFTWMKRSYELLDSLRACGQGKHYADFIPALIADLNAAAHDYGKILDEYEEMTPRITSVSPAPGGKPATDGDKVTIAVKFSVDMLPIGSSCQVFADNPSDAGKHGGISIAWSDARTCLILITMSAECARQTGFHGFAFAKSFTMSRYGLRLEGQNAFVYEL